MDLFLNKITSFKTSYLLALYISYFFIIVLLGYSIFFKKYLMICIFIILLIQLYKQYKQINYIFNKFYLERHLNNYNFKLKSTVLLKNFTFSLKFYKK